MKTLKNLAPRETLTVVLGAVFVTAALLWIGVYEPAIKHRETLMRKIDTKERELIEVKALADRYVEETKGFNRLDSRLESRPEGFSPLSEMESLASSSGVGENITSMEPMPPVSIGDYTESLIKIEIEKTTLPGLVRLLESMRGSKNVLRVKRIAVKPMFEDQSMLDVSMTVAAYEVAR